MMMPLLPQVVELKGLLSKLPAKDHDFANSLIASATKYAEGRSSKPLTANQLYWVEKLVRVANGTVRKTKPPKAKHAEPGPMGRQAEVDVEAIVQQVLERVPAFDPQQVTDVVLGMTEVLSRELVSKALKMLDERVPRRIEVVAPSKKTVKFKHTHVQFEEVLKIVEAGVHPFLVGPAGSGKTTCCEQVAQALEVEFYFSGQMTGAHELTGFVDAQGRYQTTPFREAFEKGGLFLCDEVDGSDPAVPNTLNAALANGHMSFPDKARPVKAHPNFRCVAAANTYGRGADRIYVGRNQLDGAFLDRWVFVAFDYDEMLESAMCPNVEWVRRVRRVRAAAVAEKARVVISPRASLYGATLLVAGVHPSRVEDMTIWKGMDPDLRRRLEARSTPSYRVQS